ncbi:MAG TPA: M56 family metallopeptidase, partial [Ktedonobacterales bacterium]|nr:M56 family metallopeptidase [Ktedonobacterales bacterium]
MLVAFALLATMNVLVGLVLFQTRHAWSGQQRSYLLLLAAPVSLLTASMIVQILCGAITLTHTMLPFARPAFWQWGVRWATLIALGVGVGAMCVTGFRGLLLVWWLRRWTVPAPYALTTQVSDLAKRMEVRAPAVRLWHGEHPVAATCGFWRPVMLLSPWLSAHLDADEMETVITHELAHIVRHDHQCDWLALILRDAFGYLPMSRRCYRHLRQHQEWSCDDIAVAITHHPLALASALAKVWQQSLNHRALAPATALTGVGESLSERITRLMSPS